MVKTPRLFRNLGVFFCLYKLVSDRGELGHLMSLCGRYDFFDPAVIYRVTPYYFNEDELVPDEIPLFEKTVLGYFVDAASVKVGQRCRIRPMVHLGKHLFATLEADTFADSLQGRFHLWLEYKKDSTYDAALESFFNFLDDNISKPRLFKTTEALTDFDQAIQYYHFVHEKTPYVAVQPRVESKYLPPYQKPEFFAVSKSGNFERFQIPFYLVREGQTYWYESVYDFYKGGGHGFPTRSRWMEDGPLFEAFVGGGWVEVFPYDKYLTKSG